MFKQVKVVDTVRVPPNRFSEPLDESVLALLRETYEGLLDRDLGSILSVISVEDIGIGKIIPGDGSTFHEVVFRALCYVPEIQELVLGEVVEVTEKGYGAFVRIGPFDGLVHVSQITDDYIVFDKKRKALVGKESNKVLKEGDRVRARIVTVSISGAPKREVKVGLTMRQPALGKFEWIQAEKQAAEEAGEAKK